MAAPLTRKEYSTVMKEIHEAILSVADPDLRKTLELAVNDINFERIQNKSLLRNQSHFSHRVEYLNAARTLCVWLHSKEGMDKSLRYIARHTDYTFDFIRGYAYERYIFFASL